MRIVVGRGSHRQEWELNSNDYQRKRSDCNALLMHVGLKDKRHD